MNSQYQRTVRKQLVDFGFEFLREVLQQRSQPRLQSLSGPHKFFAEVGQLCSRSLLADNERHLEEIRPLLNQIPSVPVRNASSVGRCRNLSGRANFGEEFEHDLHGLGVAVVLETPYRINLDLDHVRFRDAGSLIFRIAEDFMFARFYKVISAPIVPMLTAFFAAMQ